MDQAEGLRRLLSDGVGVTPAQAGPRPGALRLARVVAVTSGKGGVGKTSVSINVALAARELGWEVGVVDGDLGLANVDIMLGMSTGLHLGDVLDGRCTVVEALSQAPGGIRVLAGASGLFDLAEASQEQLRRLVAQIRELDRLVDLLIIDTGAGIGRQVVSFLASARELLVVLTPEPTSLTDAYSLLKVLGGLGAAPRIYSVVNMCRRPADGERVAARLASVVGRFLGLEVLPLGVIPYDEAASRAVIEQVPLLLAHPKSPAASAIRQITRRLLGEAGGPAGGGLSGALRRMAEGLRRRVHAEAAAGAEHAPHGARVALAREGM